ncbi:hypothetical protein GOP47_0015109 [Adiantum capillus-veneris]|uniref:COP1-interacting protein 7 n=1 Tax=Adiantum capillus-veneris TaxID=13818 RepID=A0A9D4ZFE6_ADICA|nr:hypothetical protein GOP47_0014629 [Adiantum capillus-veneris]KAI5070766.1 hypothetical protein GOP47_0015109 [Adiantum capillus-veneris]
MRPDTQLDYAVFQLNPTRTRCELHISAQGMTYKLAAGLLQPFVAHLKAAEEQVAGGGYSVRLEPPDPGCAGWFTKGTMERFVRFVSTPEVLERVSNIEMELLEIEKNIRLQSGDASEDTQYAEELLSKLAHSVDVPGGMPCAPEHPEKPAKESFESANVEMENTTKQRLLRALDARHMMLEKELGVALARAIAAGFTIEHIKDLILFAETFGAKRLWGACSNFMSLCQTRQRSGVWQDDLKLSAAEVAQAETAFGGNVVHQMGFRENLDLQGRGSRQDDLRRASLPSDGRAILGDSGLEKLTRRGSLDELTGEFLQVAARMRSSGMMGGASLDWPNNWQAPHGGNRSISGEMQVGVARLGGNNDLRDSESAHKLTRGHQIMAPWRGQPQNHPIHNVHPLMHGPMHPSIPAPFGFPGLSVPGYSYPPYPGNPYMGHAYAETNGWQFPSPVAPPFWPHPMFNNTAVSLANEQGEVALPTTEKHDASHNTLNSNEVHEELTPPPQKSTRELSNTDGEHPSSTQELARELSNMVESHEKSPSSTQNPANDQLPDNELHGERPGSTQLPAGGLSVNEPPAFKEEPTSKLHVESTKKPASDLSVNEETVVTQQHLPNKNEREEESTNDSLDNGDGEPYAERTRRLPIRASSPSRRSASPLRKVQFGRSGSRRAIRNVNYVAQTIPEKIEGEHNDRELSSESWSEDNDDGKKDEEPKEQPVRARVQDVIGLFERRKDVGDTKLKPLRKEIGRSQSNNSVLKRWTDSGALKKETSETEGSRANNRIRASVASADDVSEKGSNQHISERKEERTSILQGENAVLVIASNIESCPGQQAFHEQAGAKVSRKNLANPESGVPNNVEAVGGNSSLAQRELSSEPDVHVVPESSKELAGKSCNMGMHNDAQVLGADIGDDIQCSQEETDVHESLNDGQEGEDENLEVDPEAAHSKKASARDAKAKAMQELLERRKAASGNRSGKSNPLVEAQLRAEKLRAYKVGLQKSKQEKDEEEKKRIEDLKSQRKERIAARGSQQGGSSAQSPITKQSPQTLPLTGNRSSPTTISHKLSSSSPRNNINVSGSLSPSLPKSKGAAGNKLPRTPTGTPKANENVLSLSVPSLSELKKESPRATLAVRSSTGSQRLSQLRKNLKDADPNTSPTANGHSGERRRSLPLATVRKGIPPATDSKNEGLPVVKKPSKGSMVANRQQKKAGNSPASVKPKKPATEAVEATSFSEKVDAPNGVAVEVTLELATEANDKQEFNADVNEATLDNCSSLHEVGTTEDDQGYAQIRAPASSETEIFCPTDDSSCNIDGASGEPLLIESLKETEAPMEVVESHAVSMACIEGGECIETVSDKNAEDNHCSPVAHASQTDENPTALKDIDAGREEVNDSFVEELPNNVNKAEDELASSPAAEEVYNPPRALPSDSPLHTPRSLPRLHEAIQQAHSPELIPGINRSRKTRGVDEPAGSLRSSKDHAKGFKRLLLLGRKSSRSSAPNAADWVSVSVGSEGGEDGEETAGNAKKVGGGSAIGCTDNVSLQADKVRVESYSGNSSSKGSRSFFSLSTFRGKGDGK